MAIAVPLLATTREINVYSCVYFCPQGKGANPQVTLPPVQLKDHKRRTSGRTRQEGWPTSHPFPQQLFFSNIILICKRKILHFSLYLKSSYWQLGIVVCTKFLLFQGIVYYFRRELPLRFVWRHYDPLSMDTLRRADATVQPTIRIVCYLKIKQSIRIVSNQSKTVPTFKEFYINHLALST